MPDFITYPTVTLISRPQFIEPEHLRCEWVGEGSDGEHLIEYAGRLCYLSYHNPAQRTTEEYIGNIKRQGHGSVMEHANYSLLIEGVSRSLTHELVRHRAGMAYSQISQRYVDESDTQFVVPPAVLDVGDPAQGYWEAQRILDREEYMRLADKLFEHYSYIDDKVHRRKMAREAARSVLPNSTETKIVATGNCRAWRTILELRCSEGAEREIRRLGLVLLNVLGTEAPAVFEDFEVYTAADGLPAARPRHHKV